jgi:hypothetical protein
VGCEARKIPAEEDVFFLDFYLYRTYQACGIQWVCTGRGATLDKVHRATPRFKVC